MGVTNMNAILTEERESLFYKFGGLIAFIFLIIIAPAYNYHKLQNELKTQQEMHEQYVESTSNAIAGLSSEVDILSKDYQKTVAFKKEATCLADNIYHEIGTKSEEGMRAVAQVTLNRKREGFAPTICGVVHQKNNGVCQFSWVCESYNQPNQYAYQKAYDIARKSLTSGIALSRLHEALYYHADYVNPSWKNQKNFVAQIGPHVFYSEK